MVMVGVPADGLDAASRAALRRGTGGILVFNPARGGDPSVTDVAATTREARAEARARGPIPLLVSTDQEGGKVQKLDGQGFAEIPSAAQQGRDPRGLVDDARGWGATLARAGVNVDLAPVADVVDPALGAANAPVGKLDRGFGTDADTVSAAVTAFVRGMGQSGVSATLKHFPGLGKVRENTDFAGGVVDTATTRADPDLAPFRAGIAAGAPLVMMSSARYARIDPDERALFSRPVITDVLRRGLGFDGVVMTDDVGVAEALSDVPVGQRATRFVEAGGDLVLSVRPADAAPMIAALVSRAGSDPAFRARVDESARRVLALKAQRAGLCR